MKSSLNDLLIKLIKLENIRIDWDEFNFQFQSHPSYPSLHAVTGVLDHFKIENIAAKVPVTEDVIAQLPTASLIQYKSEYKEDLVLLEIKNETYYITKENNKTEKITLNKLLNSFSGIILAIEKNDETIETTSSNKFLNYTLASVSIISLMGIFYFLNTSQLFNSYFGLSIFGLIISISIIKQDLGLKSTIGDAFCSSDTNTKNCHAVLSSKGAKLFGNYKLSDLCLVYFSGLSLSLLLLEFQNFELNSIFIISSLAIPVTFYSIYYQAFNLKKWCLLCLSIVGVLWLQGISTVMLGTLDFNITALEIFSLIMGFASVTLFWNVLKPIIKNKLENKNLKIEFQRFKRNYNIFSALLKNEKPLSTSLKETHEIVLGNPNAATELLIVTNPYCGYCRPLHDIVEDLLDSYRKELKIILRFNINLKDPESDIVKLCSNLLFIYKNHLEKFEEALNDAYRKIPYRDWAKKWNHIKHQNNIYFDTLQSQKDWCLVNKINFTPYISINGYPYPNEYERKDIKYFIEDLLEDRNILHRPKNTLEKVI